MLRLAQPPGSGAWLKRMSGSFCLESLHKGRRRSRARSTEAMSMLHIS